MPAGAFIVFLIMLAVVGGLVDEDKMETAVYVTLLAFFIACLLAV